MSTKSIPRGERLLPSLLDEIATNDPDRVLYSISITDDPADGFRDISAHTFANAVNRCAWYLERELGGRGQNLPTIAYIGPSDLMYGVLILAAIKTGYKLMLNSPRNTLDAHLRLFAQMDCHTFLVPSDHSLPVIKEILENQPMKTVSIKDIHKWFDDASPVELYPYNKTFEEAKYEPFVVVHTSGSTGFPKPIVQTHATHTAQDAYLDVASMGYAPIFPAPVVDLRCYTTFPLFHTAGFMILLPMVLYAPITAVLAPFPASAETVNQVHLHANVQVSMLTTATLIELSKNPEYVENLARLKYVTFGGAPCPPDVGKILSTKTHLLSGLGTTELSLAPNEICDREDFQYLKFSPLFGAEFRHYADDLYEQVIIRKADTKRFQSIFGTFPDLQEWPMKDLYSKHPTKADVWMYRGRTDDIVTFHTGDKVNPLPVENIIAKSPDVSAVLVAGQGRFQSSLLVEAKHPPGSESEKEKMIEDIWPFVERANNQVSSNVTIHRDMILFTEPKRPMLRGGKGSVQRRLTYELYAKELDALYSGRGFVQW